MQILPVPRGTGARGRHDESDYGDWRNTLRHHPAGISDAGCSEHHADRTEIWLIQYKKATGKSSLDYVEAVEEAICFGWIDSFEKTIDSERYARASPPPTKVQLDRDQQGAGPTDDRIGKDDGGRPEDTAGRPVSSGSATRSGALVTGRLARDA